MLTHSFKFSVDVMSKEKLEFNFPAVFTIGVNNLDSLTNYFRYLLNQNDKQINYLIRRVLKVEIKSSTMELGN